MNESIFIIVSKLYYDNFYSLFVSTSGSILFAFGRSMTAAVDIMSAGGPSSLIAEILSLSDLIDQGTSHHDTLLMLISITVVLIFFIQFNCLGWTGVAVNVSTSGNLL